MRLRVQRATPLQCLCRIYPMKDKNNYYEWKREKKLLIPYHHMHRPRDISWDARQQ